MATSNASLMQDVMQLNAETSDPIYHPDLFRLAEHPLLLHPATFV
jgi:hypothetical protein